MYVNEPISSVTTGSFLLVRSGEIIPTGKNMVFYATDLKFYWNFNGYKRKKAKRQEVEVFLDTAKAWRDQQPKQAGCQILVFATSLGILSIS